MSDIFALFEKIRSTPKTADTNASVSYLIVGLGNPGAEYAKTRHNTGFRALDLLAEKYGIRVVTSKFNALVGDGMIGNYRCILMKPQTFMNASGEAVGPAAAFYKIAPDHIVVLYDDIYLPIGKLRIRKNGSAGGHNGMKSIISHVGSEDFPRIRIGVGLKPSPDYDLAAWVLGKIPKEDEPLFGETLTKACDAIPFVLDRKFEEAMCKFN